MSAETARLWDEEARVANAYATKNAGGAPRFVNFRRSGLEGVDLAARANGFAR